MERDRRGRRDKDKLRMEDGIESCSAFCVPEPTEAFKALFPDVIRHI